ncbi:SusD/RagB family nutrient-binding outer membrane lipoprotein [Psychroserpens luteolus]|uniref:SusD/RagB family nutrient-binding outer membrane lipoprotein n=1 Tax=Psychroserpens luteolus TaxID=2855840 RepID=UPI001E49C462|nr:SusD/RagB family nutrient-binding outer membrane lipoprotein [Psychroserpens luteolus]MCD2260502.1 SusD/RagB family nutrient-binding outer membrane lipoprotein [Psychroserpens luteolus]
MKNINKIKYTIMSLALLCLTFSCNDVLVNEDPNGVVIDQLPPEVILPGALTVPAGTLMTTMNGLGNTMIATWSGNAQQVQAPYFVEFQYQLTTDFYSGIWDNLMARTGNLTQIIENEYADNYDYFKGASKIYRAFYFQYLVDLYGDIPFTDIHQRGDLLFPEYDNQTDVYVALIADINDAIAQIQNTDTSTAIGMGSNDVIMGGNMDMWIKFGNTVKLRMLLRMYDAAQGTPDLQSIVNGELAALNNANFLGAGENVTINPGYSDEEDRMNPFAETFGYDPGQFGNASNQTFSNLRAGPTTFLVEFLDGTTTGVSDARLQRLYAPRGGQATIQGNTQGGEDQPSRIGPGLLISPQQDGYIMTASESLFLQSEAVFRGILNSGNAKGLFESAIQSSFDRLGASIGSYLNDANNVNGIGWDGSADKLEAIITQKWIDLGGTNGIETWIEFTRTGFPSNMPLPDITNRPNRPLRLLYPTSEYTGNSANVSVYNQTVDTAFDTPVFWDVN